MRDPRLTQFAKSMRKSQTEPEIGLWLELRAKRFAGTKFRRQKVIGPYIVDFSCRLPMLVIEIDGDTHGGTQSYDAERTRFLEMQGYRVIRFTNGDVMRNLEGVLDVIAQVLLTAPLPSPLRGSSLSPEGERAL